MIATATLTLEIKQVTQEPKDIVSAKALFLGKQITVYAYGKAGKSLLQLENQTVIAGGDLVGGSKQMSLKATQITPVANSASDSRIEVIQQLISEVNSKNTKQQLVAALQSIGQAIAC